MQHAPGSTGSGVGARLRSYAADAIGILQTRLELLATEAAEEKLRLGTFLGYAATAFFFLGFGAVFLALLITVLLWDSHRLLALGIFAALFLVIDASRPWPQHASAGRDPACFPPALRNWNRTAT
ncbi:MAG: phage holin family protein [Rhodocyclaceae bacterium]|nr:phage holin family protein [Rhodocyclaceae bacterium]